MLPRFATWAMALLLGTALLAPMRRAAAQAFVVVVNEAGPSSLSKNDVARIFLKTSDALMPVDQVRDSKVRPAFSRFVLGRSVSAVLTYWQQQIFSGGGSPPPVKGSDAEVLASVRGNPKAIGYVSADAVLGAGVKLVAIQ
ncbi:MAG: hypothetical protein JWL95_304 [Gemmatimonadetes bacterium]|nr:hypothetical protein [Gemmatimonadota bacterium]